MPRQADDISQTDVPGTIFFVGSGTTPAGHRSPTDNSTGDKTQVKQSHDTTEHNVVLVPRPLDTARDPLVCLFLVTSGSI